jgi:hypothetical protein
LAAADATGLRQSCCSGSQDRSRQPVTTTITSVVTIITMAATIIVTSVDFRRDGVE